MIHNFRLLGNDLRQHSLLQLLVMLFAHCLFLCVWLAAAPQGLNACGTESQPPELALVNGVIYTGDAAHLRVEAMAIHGEKIVAVGTTRQIRALAGPKTRVIDLHGAFAMPGFNDAHIHLASGGQAKLGVDFAGATGLAELQQRSRARLAEPKPAQWIAGRGLARTPRAGQRVPARHAAAARSRDLPRLFRYDG